MDTMTEEKSLEGWVPVIGPDLSLVQVIDMAFDYRGNVTIVKRDGAELVGYLYNRDATAKEPFLQLFDEEGNGPFKLRYSEIRDVRFTGRDTAAGKSWDAWVARKQQDKIAQAGPGGNG